MLRKMTVMHLFCWLSLAVAAQDTAQVSTLHEVIITANRIPQKQDQTGKVVTIITKAQLDQNHGKSLGQLLNEQAGISINGALNAPGTNQGVYMRGAAIGRTLILLNGIPVYDPSFINGETDLQFFSTSNMERIEIARGAQSTLYGSDAIAGVINIITVKPNNLKKAGVRALASYGSLNSLNTQLQADGKTGKLAYSARWAFDGTDGFSAAKTLPGNEKADRDGRQGHHAQATLNLQATSKLSFRSIAQYSTYKASLDNGAFTDDRDFTTANTNRIAGAGMVYQAEKFTLTANYTYSQNRRSYLDDSAHVPSFSKFSSNAFDGKSHFAEVYVNAKLAKKLTAVAGADGRLNGMNSSFLSISAWGPYLDVFRDTSVRQGSVYASLLYAGSRLNLEGGMRFNHHQRYGGNSTFTFNPSFRINDRYRVFGSIASGFKAPTLYQLYSAFGNTELQPETSVNYEAGLQQTSRAFNGRLVYFNRLIRNGIDFDNNAYRYVNINRQRVQGLELEMTLKPAKAVTVTANYTLLKAREQSQSRISFADTTYRYLLRRPVHQVNVETGWQATAKWYLSARLRYVSARFDVAGYQQPDEKMKAYLLPGAYMSYTISDKARFFLQWQNIGNVQFTEIRGFSSIPSIIQAGASITLL